MSVLLVVVVVGGCGDFDIPGAYKSSSTSSKRPSGSRIIVNATDNGNQGTGSGSDDVTIDPGTGTGTGTGTSTGTSGGTGTGTGTSTPPAGTCGNEYETEVLNLCNKERAAAGLSAFLCDLKAVKVAHDYSQVMCDQNWFDHTGPDGSSPFERMQAGGISYRSAGENIAAGQRTPAEVMDSWMNSSGHRANILGDFKYLGVGYVTCSNGNMSTYWTQDFWK